MTVRSNACAAASAAPVDGARLDEHGRAHAQRDRREGDRRTSARLVAREPPADHRIVSSARGLVAGPADGQDQLGDGGVGLDLGAQPADCDVDQPRIAQVVVAPDPIEQDVAAEHLAGVPGELDK